MHWVDRGPEPAELGPVRSHYGPGWIRYYRHGQGSRPTDNYWLRFRGNLQGAFSSICVYCERLSGMEVDHFRPKSKFPEQVYEWSNWVLACRDCNFAKLDKWPTGGYVDPCARSRSARPDVFFRFDTLTGDIIPSSGLSQSRRLKAERPSRLLLDLATR